MDKQNKSSGEEETRGTGAAAVGRDIQTGGGDFVGRDHIIFSGNVIVLNSLPEAVLQQLTWIVNLTAEGSPGTLTGFQGLPANEDRNTLQRSIDQVLSLFDNAAREGIKALGVSAGEVQISRAELLLKKAILQRAEAEEMLINQIGQQREGSAASIADESERSIFARDFKETPKRSILEGAYALLQQANEIDPANTEVLLQMAELLVELTPDDPRDEERILERVQQLLREPKNEREKFQLAQASFLMATTRDQVDRKLLRQARKLFESLGRTEWLRQCDALLAGIPAEAGSAGEGQHTDTQALPHSDRFNPVGRWQIQVMDAAGSMMFMEFHANGTFQSSQQVDIYGLNVQRAGQWAYNPFNNALEIQGMIDGIQPFVLGIFVQGQQENDYYGLGTDGYGYLLTRV